MLFTANRGRGMRVRQLWTSCLICLGCHSISAAPRPPDEGCGTFSNMPVVAGTLENVPHGSASAVGSHTHNDLTLAAAAIVKGDDAAACRHLARFLEAHPNHRNARFYHAELLLKLGRHAQSARQFELAIRSEQQEAEPDLKHLVHCHTQLVRIGETLDDEYGIHLHRGIGMYVLAQQRVVLESPNGDLSTESLLCKATAELRRARSLRPGAAQPCWYLYAAWRQLAQPGPARRCLAETRRRSAYSDLTPAEQRDLHLTCQAVYR